MQQQALDRSLPGFATVTDRLIAASFDGPATSGVDQKIRNAQRVIVVKKLIALAGKGSSPAVRGVALLKLESLRSRSAARNAKSGGQAQLIADLIHRFPVLHRRGSRRLAGTEAAGRAALGDWGCSGSEVPLSAGAT